MGGRRGKRSGWSALIGVALVLALVGLIIELLRIIWPFLLVAAAIVAIVWLWTRGRRTPLMAETAQLPLPTPARPTHTVPTARGDLVRSRGEARIADFLHRRGIAYSYEPTISGFRPDFYIPQWNLIIEYWGMDNPEYNRRRATKTRAFRANGYALIGLDAKDWDRLEHELARKLYAFDRTIYQRAPPSW